MTRLVLIGILLILIAWAFWRLVDVVIATLGGKPAGRRPKAPPVRLVRDPVCGTYVPPKESLSLRSGNTTHYFCSEQCRTSFRKSA